MEYLCLTLIWLLVNLSASTNYAATERESWGTDRSYASALFKPTALFATRMSMNLPSWHRGEGGDEAWGICAWLASEGLKI